MGTENCGAAISTGVSGLNLWERGKMHRTRLKFRWFRHSRRSPGSGYQFATISETDWRNAISFCSGINFSSCATNENEEILSRWELNEVRILQRGSCYSVQEDEYRQDSPFSQVLLIQNSFKSASSLSVSLSFFLYLSPSFFFSWKYVCNFSFLLIFATNNRCLFMERRN